MPTLREIFSDIADAIRTKTGKSVGIYPVDMASEIERKESGGDYKLEKMPSGAISSFNDGAALPLNNLKISIEPIQEGSGDPSPENIRPISGWNAVDVNVSGVNVWDEEWENGRINVNTGENAYGNGIRSKNKISIKSSTEYRALRGSYSDASSIIIYYYDILSNYISYENKHGTNTVFITPSNAAYIRFNIQTSEAATYNHDISINYPSTDTEYHAYNRHTYTIPFTDSQGNPITVYGGELDVVNGVLTVDKGYIASYNGETLPSTWISDRDVYVEGTSPTTGAQVVYELATPITYQYTPTAVKSLLDTNNIWADTGDIINGEYFKGAESSGSGIIYYIKNIRIECEVI